MVKSPTISTLQPTRANSKQGPSYDTLLITNDPWRGGWAASTYQSTLYEIQKCHLHVSPLTHLIELSKLADQNDAVQPDECIYSENATRVF